MASEGSALELDSHADSPVVGRHAHIIRRTGRTVRVSGFTNQLGRPIPVPVVDAAICYDCEFSGKCYIMIIRNGLYLKQMDVCLIPPFMMRMAGLTIDECPKFLAKTPSITNHSVYFPDHELRLPLKLHGIISYLPVRMPSNEELNETEHVLELTPMANNWDPHNEEYSIQEDAMTDFSGEIKEPPKRQFIVSSVRDRVGDYDAFATAVTAQVDAIHRIYSIRTSDGNKTSINPRDLATLWNIGLETAKKTLQMTTCLCPRNADDITLNRRYNTNDRMIRYKHLPTPVYMDTMFASKRAGKSFRGYTCAQVYASDFGWVHVDPMKSEKDIHHSLKGLFKDIGVPSSLIADGARAQIQGRAREICEEAGCNIVELEKGTPASNRAERFIQTLKTGSKHDMKSASSPIVFWCYCIERRALIENATAKDNYHLKGNVPHSAMTGEVTDISNLCRFGWYEWVKFRKPGEQYPFPTERLGRCLGPARNKGNAMSQYVLTESGEVLPIQTIRKLLPSELTCEAEKGKREKMDEYITQRYGDSKSVPENWVQRRRRPGDPIQFEDDAREDDDEDDGEVTGDGILPDVDSIPDLDEYINAEVLLPQDGEYLRAATVVGRARDRDGMPIGEYHHNPILNSRVYDVMFPDGSIQQYAANIIAENIFSQVDEDGHRFMLLDEIVDHRKGQTAYDKDEGFVTNANGKRSRRITTKGWKFLINWKDGTQGWVPLSDIKDSNPIEVAEYVQVKGLEDEPAFAWWVGHVLKKRNRIIASVNAKLRQKTHKYGIELPRSVTHAYELDKQNNDTFWRDAIKKEMKNVLIAFELLDQGEEPPRHLKELGVHLVFDVKMDLTRKARLVADGHKTADPKGSTYAGVVSRETVRIAFTYAALNELDVLAADIQNAYLTAPTSEDFFIVCGPEFGSENIGRKAIVKRALYGTKSAGRDFRNHLRDCMSHMGYESCKADADLWMRVGKSNKGEEYYEYMLLYVDDCLCVSSQPKAALDQLGRYFTLKPGSVGPPKIYLGAKVGEVELPNGVKAWSISTSQYAQEAVSNVEKRLRKKGESLKRGVNAVLTNNYHPECDASPELDSTEANYYLSLIGILRWIVEMGRLDICTEVSMMSSYVAAPREGHMQQVLHIFAYLKNHHNARMVLDPTYPMIDEEAFIRRDWKEFYGEGKEAKPPGMPRPLGRELLIRAFVDADFAGDQLLRRSRTGFIIMANMAPVYWLSRKQSSVETSSFGSEFCALRQCCEYLRGLRYKVRMMGIPLENPCFIYGDNQSVLWNTTVPDSTLRKKTSSVAYHFVREGVSMDKWRTSYVNTRENPSDIMTKSLPAGKNRYRKVRMVLYDIYPEDKYS